MILKLKLMGNITTYMSRVQIPLPLACSLAALFSGFFYRRDGEIKSIMNPSHYPFFHKMLYAPLSSQNHSLLLQARPELGYGRIWFLLYSFCKNNIIFNQNANKL